MENAKLDQKIALCVSSENILPLIMSQFYAAAVTVCVCMTSFYRRGGFENIKGGSRALYIHKSSALLSEL